MIYMWFTGKNYYNLAVEKDRDSLRPYVDKASSPGQARMGLAVT
jgi:hypothetical protein